MPNWPPLNFPYPKTGTTRTVDTISNPTHVEDHNDINNATNDLIHRVNAREAIKFIPNAVTTVTIDLAEARNYLLWVDNDIAQFNIVNFSQPATSPIDPGTTLYYSNDFTVTIVFRKNATPYPVITWNLINGDAVGSPSYVVNWPYGVPPTLSNNYLKSHVLYFNNVVLGYNGYVVAEELTQSV